MATYAIVVITTQ